MTASTRTNFIRTYEQSYRNESDYIPTSRQTLLRSLSGEELDALFQEYFDVLGTQIFNLREQHSPVAQPAQALLDEIKITVSNRLNFLFVDKGTLVDILYQTNALLKVPYLDQSQKINPDFVKQVETFGNTLNDIKKDVKNCKLMGLAYAVISAATVAATIAIFIFTAPTLILPLFGGLMAASAAITTGVAAIGMFKCASKLNKIADKIEPLAALGRETEVSPQTYGGRNA